MLFRCIIGEESPLCTTEAGAEGEESSIANLGSFWEKPPLLRARFLESKQAPYFVILGDYFSFSQFVDVEARAHQQLQSRAPHQKSVTDSSAERLSKVSISQLSVSQAALFAEHKVSWAQVFLLFNVKQLLWLRIKLESSWIKGLLTCFLIFSQSITFLGKMPHF